MNQRFTGCIVGAFVAGLALLPACSVQPAHGAAAPRQTDISQVPPLQSAPGVFEPAFASGAPSVAPGASDNANNATLAQTKGMKPRAVTGGPKEPLPAAEAEPPARAPWPRPKLELPALQPNAGRVQTGGEERWKSSLPPLRLSAGE